MQVGGAVRTSSEDWRATAWYGDPTSAVDLHQYVKGAYLGSIAEAIEANGVIVGAVFDSSGSRRAVMWWPVAAPSLAVAVSGADLEISFITQSGLTDQLESTEALGGDWTDIGIPVSGTGGKTTIRVQMSPGREGEFFRVRRFQ